MLQYCNILLLFSCFLLIKCSFQDALLEGMLVGTEMFAFWKNATVPFYINPEHFHYEQALVILTCLSIIARKTCIRFAPTMVAPMEGQHVLVFANPDGVKRCRIELKGHSTYEPHVLVVGYECLKSPEIDMLVLRALGMPFEHSRMSRDIYIDVLIENIEPSYIALFTKDGILPPPLRSLPYDMNSVMHFGPRAYSKNGHRTILFKNRNFVQNRKGITPTDVKKIEVIYGPECKKRDRAEKVALCQSYPDITRRKREIPEPPMNRSLRVNRYITPPPHELVEITEITEKNLPAITKDTKQECTVKTLGIVKETSQIIDLVYQLSNLALKNAREKYCNESNATTEFNFRYEKVQNNSSASDVLGIGKIIADFAKTIVDSAGRDVTEFCQNSENIEAYQSQCKFDNDTRCPKTYRTSKSEAARVTTDGKLEDEGHRSQNTDNKTSLTSLKSNRRKREATVSNSSEEINVKNKKVTHKEKNLKEEKEIKTEEVTEINLKNKMKDIRKERVKEIRKSNNTINKFETVSMDLSTNTLKVKEDKKEKSRKFSEKRYKVQNREDSEDESALTMENKTLLEPQKSLINTKDVLQNLLVKSLTAVISPALISPALVINKEEIVESVQSVEETKVNKVHEKSGKEDSGISEEKIHKKADQSVDEIEDVESEEVEESLEKDHKSKRKIPKTVELTKLNKEFYKERMWPEGEVIYAIQKLPHYDLDDLRSRLVAVNSILKQKTCVKLREVVPKEAPGFDDYLILDNSSDYVTGKVGRKQNFGSIELFEGGQHKQHTAMMVMAMLGFYFEVSRHDRDKHIRVHNRHIRPDKLHHFEKLSAEATLKIPYDFKSAMHPSFDFWRKIGKTNLATVATYKSQDPDGSIMHALGQNPELLSESDILKINSVYGVDCFQSNRARKQKESVRMKQQDKEVVIQ